MFKATNHKIEFKSKSSTFFLISCFLISFFLLNQISYFSLSKSVSKKIDFFADVKNAKYPSQFHFATIPSVESVITVNLLEESEDDNKQKTSQDLSDIIYQKFSKNEHNYSSVLRSRYLQFVLSIHKRSDIPFFILHHSWKTHLS
jgi:hypothetical protein